ncbi:MAG: DUF4199 domain-containing protein [Bacteroidetes bacterium]|nr:MAG: DUF4199 domain-containing protein [Bacteroidota bacterium]
MGQAKKTKQNNSPNLTAMAVLDSIQEPQAPAPFWNTALRFGAYLALTLIGVSLVSYLLGIMPVSGTAMAINFVVAIGATALFAALAIKFQRDNLDHGFISFGRGFLVGLVTVAIGVFASSLWNYVLINFIDPGYVDNLKEAFMETWGQNIPEDKLEEALANFDKTGEIGTVLKNGAIGAIVLGLISGLIGAGIMKKDQPVT